jgi:hypothetical protein
MDADRLYEGTTSLRDAEKPARPWQRTVAAGRRVSMLGGALLAASSAPLLYRGITGAWPGLANGSARPDNTKLLRRFNHG